MKSIGIVTTASLPWLTGTSIVPLYHAVYLKKRGYNTTLYVPWLPPSQQFRCFPHHRFASADEQRDYIARWLSEDLRPFCPVIRFYPAFYVAPIESIGPRLDLNLDLLIADHDLLILAEPEHLFAACPWSRIKKHRAHVIGLVMTHYEYYHSRHIPRFLARWYQHYSRFLMQRMCHLLVAMAAVQQDVYSLPICRVAPLNAVDEKFFRPPPARRNGPCYFMGKFIAEKGLEELFAGLQAAGEDVVDLYGSGKMAWLNRLAHRYGVQPDCKGLSYHPWDDLAQYRIFVNCSQCEYLCTTTANALVMQQWTIIPRHPSNEFYYRFKNCLTYGSRGEFVEQFEFARTHEPIFDPQVRELSWDACCDRLIAIIQERVGPAG